MNSIQAISNVNFKSAEAISDIPAAARTPKVVIPDETDTLELSTRAVAPAKPKTAKKFGVGIASFFAPGLGQLCNGQGLKALGHFAGIIGLTALATVTAPVSIPLSLAAGIGAFAVRICSVVDAVKNA